MAAHGCDRSPPELILQAVGVQLGLLLPDVRALGGSLGFDERQGQAVVAPQHVVDEALARRVGHAGDLEFAVARLIERPAGLLEQQIDEQVARLGFVPVVRLGRLGRGHDLVQRGAWPAKGDVLLDGDCEQRGFLQHDADLVAQRVERDRAHVDAVDQHLPVRRVIEAGDEVEHGRLAGAGRPQQGDDLAGLRFERHILQHGMAFRVGKMDVLEADGAVDWRHGHGVAGILHGRGRVEDVEDALPGGGGHRHRGHDHADAAHGHYQLAQVGRECHQFAQGKLAADHEQAAVPDDEDRADIGDQIEHGHVDGAQAHCEGRQIEPRLVLALEALDLGALLGKGLDDARPAQVLLQPRGQHAQLLLDGERQRAHLPAEMKGAPS